MKYLIYARNMIGAIIEVKGDVSAEQYGQMQIWFQQLYGPTVLWAGDRFATMIKLCEHDCFQGIYYDANLAGSDGMSYKVISLPDSPYNAVKSTIRMLRRDHDVVSLSVLEIKGLVDFQPEVDKILACKSSVEVIG